MIRRGVALVSVVAFVLLLAPVSSAFGAADLAVTKDGPSDAGPGQVFSYTITVENVGDAAATTAVVSDPLPGDLTYQGLAGTHDGWDCSGQPEVGDNGTVSCSKASVAPGEQATFTIRVEAPDATPAGTMYTNTATVSADSDGNGANDSDSVTTTISAPPTANDDTATVTEDSGANTIDVLANDTGAPGTKQVQFISQQPSHGSAQVTNGGANVSYTPSANFCGSDTFGYSINGGTSATVSVTVSCVDDPPTAVNDGATVSEDSDTTAIDVLANDTDVDGGPKSIASVTQPAHGTVTASAGYKPSANYCGPDSFTYTLSPGGSTATVTITVACVDDAPVAVNDTATVAQDSGSNAIDVLANDTDIDAGQKSVASVTQPAHGTVLADASYQPAPGYCGPDSFTYTLNGGSTATVAITVSCALKVKLSPSLVLMSHGKAKLRVDCEGDRADTCKGSVRLRPAKGKATKAARFSVGAGLGKVVKFRPTAAMRKAIARKGQLRVTAVATYTQIDGTPATAKRKVTLLK